MLALRARSRTNLRTNPPPFLPCDDTRQVEIAQVLHVLRCTKDGDDLAPGDLVLSEQVVNYGAMALSTHARERWQAVREMVERGAYERPWLHGVKYLEAELGGFVSWKGTVVEHFSFKDLEAERRAAQTLGACCRFLEESGEEVTAASVSHAFSRARHGEGLGVPRWILASLLEPHRAVAAVVEVEQHEILAGWADTQEFCVGNRAREWGVEPSRICAHKIVCREDFDCALEQLRQSCDWAARALHWRAYSNGQHAVDLQEVLQRRVIRDDLPSRAELLERVFAGEGRALAAAWAETEESADVDQPTRC